MIRRNGLFKKKKAFKRCFGVRNVIVDLDRSLKEKRVEFSVMQSSTLTQTQTRRLRQSFRSLHRILKRSPWRRCPIRPAL